MNAPTPQNITVQSIDIITPTRLLGLHDTFLTATAYSADGKLLATGDMQGLVKVWSVERGVLLAETQQFYGAIAHLNFSRSPDPDGWYRLLVAGRVEHAFTLTLTPEGRFNKLYHVTQANFTLLAATFDTQRRPIIACTASENDPRIYLLYADEKSFITAFRLSNEENPNAAFSQDSTRIVQGGGDGTIAIRSAMRNGSVLNTIDSRLNGVKQVIFSPDGAYIAALEDRGDRVQVFHAGSGSPVSPPIETVFAYQMMFNTDSSLLAITSKQKGGTLKLYDVHSGGLTRAIKGSSPITFSPLGNGMVCGNNYAQYSKSVMLWDSGGSPDGILSKVRAPLDEIAAREKNVQQIRALDAHKQAVLAVSFSPDSNTLATAGEDDVIRLWNMETGGGLADLFDHRADITALSFKADGSILASSSGYFMGTDDNSVRLWEMSASPREMLVFERHAARVMGVEYHPRGEWLISGDASGVLIVWQASDGKVIYRITTPSPINDLALSPSGALIATAHGSALHMQDIRVRLWNTETGELLRELEGLNDWVQDVSFRPDGNIVLATDYSGNVCGWDVNTGQAVVRYAGGVQALYNPQNTLLALAKDKTVTLNSLQGGETLMALRHATAVCSITFDPAGDLLAVGTQSGEVVLWGVMHPHGANTNTLEVEQTRVMSAKAGRYTYRVLAIACQQAQERDGDEIFLRVDGQTLWAAEYVNTKMHHQPSRNIEVSQFDFMNRRALGRNGWQTNELIQPSDFIFDGMTGPIILELWEEDNFLRGGNDFLGTVTISPAQAGQGAVTQVLATRRAVYAITYEVLFD